MFSPGAAIECRISEMDETYHVIAEHPTTKARVTVIQPRTLDEAEREVQVWRVKHNLDARVETDKKRDEDEDR